MDEIGLSLGRLDQVSMAGALDGGDVVPALRLVDLGDGGLEGGPVALGELVLVLLKELLELVDALLGGVAGLGEVAALLVLGGVRCVARRCARAPPRSRSSPVTG